MVTVRKFGEDWLVTSIDGSFLGRIHQNDNGEYHAKHHRHYIGGPYNSLEDAKDEVVRYNRSD